MPPPTATPPALLTALATRLDELRHQPCPDDLAADDWHYALNVWDYLLVYHRQGSPPPAPAHVDLLPYLPPEALAAHGPLTATDLILDAGCLSGYGLCDLALRQRLAQRPCPQLLALDIRPSYLRVLRRLAPAWQEDVPLLALHGSLTALPIRSGTIALLLSRLVLPYVDVTAALAEIARVLRPGGSALLQWHGGAYYRYRAWQSRRQPLVCAYFLRPLAAGLWFRGTGHQPRHRLFAEMAIDRQTLARAAARHGLTPIWHAPPALKPMALLRRS